MFVSQSKASRTPDIYRRVALRRYRAFVLNVVSYEYLVYRVRMNAFHWQTGLCLVNQLVEPFNEHVNVCIYE